MTHVLLALASLAYCASFVGYLWFLYALEPVAARVGLIGLVLGLVLHGSGLLLESAGHGLSPAVDLQEGLSFLAWLIGLAFLVLNRRLKLPILGAFVLPLILVVALPALSLPGAVHPLPASLHDPLLVFHVLVAFLGLAAFAVASLVGVSYLLQERELKARHGAVSLWSRLPSLELMDRLNERLTIAGFILFSLTIVTGAFFARNVWGKVLSAEPSEVMALVVWGLYGALLWGRLQSGWRGRRAAVLTLMGFSVAMVSFVGLWFCPADRHGGNFQ